MKNDVVPVEIRGILPANSGCAIFVGNEEKVFIIYIDQMVGTAITMFMRGIPKERPLTHDLVANVVDSLGGELRDIYISELRDHTYFAKLRIRLNGEMVEVDTRPSDAIALAVTASVPIYVSEDVIEEACND